jgi:hypothetical protein
MKLNEGKISQGEFEEQSKTEIVRSNVLESIAKDRPLRSQSNLKHNRVAELASQLQQKQTQN